MISTESLRHHLEGIFPNIKLLAYIKESTLTYDYKLYNTDTEEYLDIPPRFFLELNLSTILNIASTFSHYGLENANKAIKHINTRKTKLWKVLNNGRS